MIIVGELINASRKAVREAIEGQDANYILQLAKDQLEAGADYIDVNAGVFMGKEGDYVEWMINLIQEDTKAVCAIDSSDPAVVIRALKVHRGTAMINSISLEKDRYNLLMPLLAGTDLKVVALCISDEGMPVSKEDRLKNADKLINGLVKNNVKLENIYVDPLVQPISTTQSYGMEFLNAVEGIMKGYPGVHTMCGLSNISYGLPNRKLQNMFFAVMAIAKGLDGLIINPLDKQMMAGLIVAENLAGRDKYCMNYLKAFRAGKLEF
ncbi:dihydropteroate synthase [Desulfosporosinus fructosivorans]